MSYTYKKVHLMLHVACRMKTNNQNIFGILLHQLIRCSFNHKTPLTLAIFINCGSFTYFYQLTFKMLFGKFLEILNLYLTYFFHCNVWFSRQFPVAWMVAAKFFQFELRCCQMLYLNDEIKIFKIINIR